MLVAALRALRPKQWTKNLLVLAAFVFTKSWGTEGALVQVLLAFVAFCLVSSSVYVFNDLKDSVQDRQHPDKKNRPIASKQISSTSAIILSIVTVTLGILIALQANTNLLWIMGTYLAIQILYTFLLKQIPILDVFVIGSGFILRAAAGAAAISVTVSPWLLYCTGALALMLGFAKRRHEYISMGDQRETTRSSLSAYTKPTLDALILFSAGLASISYGVYSIESTTGRAYPGLIATSPLVLYGICRYLLLVFGKNEGGEPESLLLKDPHLWVTVILFVAVAVAAMMGFEVPLVGA